MKVYEQEEVVVRSAKAAHTEMWYAGPDWEVILRESPSGNSLRAVCLHCFSSPTLLYRPGHNNFKSYRGWKTNVFLKKWFIELYNV